MRKKKGHWGNQYMRDGKSIPLRERFMHLYNESPVNDNGCRIWLHSHGKDGYGVIGARTAGRYSRATAHRLAYEYFKGPIPKDLVVRHSCNNPPCVNPEHLSTGTVRDNVIDREVFGRSVRGENNGNAKLTAENVAAIRRLIAAGFSNTAIANQFHVGYSAVWDIKTGRSWTGVPCSR